MGTVLAPCLRGRREAAKQLCELSHLMVPEDTITLFLLEVNVIQSKALRSWEPVPRGGLLAPLAPAHLNLSMGGAAEAAAAFREQEVSKRPGCCRGARASKKQGQG